MDATTWDGSEVVREPTRRPTRRPTHHPPARYLPRLAVSTPNLALIVPHSSLVAGDNRVFQDANPVPLHMNPPNPVPARMNPPNPTPLLSLRPSNPSLPIPRRHSPRPPAADTTGTASPQDWFRPRRPADADPSTSPGGVAARDPGVRVRAKDGAEEKKGERKRRWWERWSRDKESYLVDDLEPLPISLTVPGTEPMSREELDRRLSCDVKIDECKVVSYEWTGKCRSCQGSGLVTYFRKKGKETICTCVPCSGIGYVRKITYREGAENLDELDNSRPP